MITQATEARRSGDRWRTVSSNEAMECVSTCESRLTRGRTPKRTNTMKANKNNDNDGPSEKEVLKRGKKVIRSLLETRKRIAKACRKIDELESELTAIQSGILSGEGASEKRNEKLLDLFDSVEAQLTKAGWAAQDANREWQLVSS